MIVAVANLKGGVGKTTTAIALATAATRDNLSVQVLDADPQSSASLWAMTAEDAGDALPFSVLPANIASVRSVKNSAGMAETWTFIDCPPSGRVVDEAVAVADMVIVPTTTGVADLAKTYETTDVLTASGRYYAVLLTRVDARTTSYRAALSDLVTRDESFFETAIPHREAVKAFFGNSFGADLYGYETVWKEIKEGLVTDGD